MVFATHSTHKLLAGLSQASQITVQDSETRKLDRNVFNEAYLMHTSTSPQYSIIASCDVAAAMMEASGGTALVAESLLEALEFRRAMRKVDVEFGKDRTEEQTSDLQSLMHNTYLVFCLYKTTKYKNQPNQHHPTHNLK